MRRAMPQRATPSSPTSADLSAIPPPVLGTEDGPVQNVLTCPLCCEIPLEPVVTPCHHVFCRPCILKAIRMRRECPNDRHPLESRDLKEIDGALRRIWEHIPVRCPVCSCWTGTVGNYVAHVRRCMTAAAESAQDYERRLRELEEKHEGEMQELQVQLATVEERFDQDLQQTIARLRTMYEHDKNEAIAVVRNHCRNERDSHVKELQEKLRGQQCATCRLLDTAYSYDRFRVVELTQLICQNLEAMPSNVDRHRIYNCVKNCHDDLKRGWADNPAHYLIDVRMLLNVCRASLWFTANQNASFERWCAKHDW